MAQRIPEAPKPPPAFDEQYTPGPDSLPQAEVPHGKTFEFIFNRSTIYPGTTRKITVYIPAQYRADKPACLYVGLDGLIFEAPTVFDNLINRHEMPVTIAVGLEPGKVESVKPEQNPRFNRSFEFDAVSDRLARFIIEELLPEVQRHKTPDGLPILISQDPNDRSVGGASTGGIGSFTLAWERPDSFRRVFSGIGTYVGMRGGERYPVLVRKTEPKPMRIFLQDGSHDELNFFLGEVGDWWLSNQTMNSALEFAGYSVKHIWGEGSHSGKHATVVFPEAMRWLWQDWPQPIVAGQSQNVFFKDILLAGQSWEAVPENDGKAQRLLATSRALRAPDSNGHEYEIDPEQGKLWLRAGGRRSLIDSGLNRPSGIVLSPDGLWLVVAENRTHWGYSYRVLSDGSVQDKQQLYWFHVPDYADDSGAGALAMDTEGRMYAATRMGVQVFDRNGRSRAIMPLPGGEIVGLAFDDEHPDVLYVKCKNHSVYKRILKIPGAQRGGVPIELPKWTPG